MSEAAAAAPLLQTSSPQGGGVPADSDRSEKITLEQMIVALELDAASIETTNAVLAEKGWPTRPDEPELRRAKIERAVVSLLRKISAKRDAVRRVLEAD